MFRRIRWVGVIAGVAVTIALMVALTAFVGLVIDPYVHDIFAVERPGGVTSFTSEAWNNYVILSSFLYLTSLPVASFAGGFVAGGMVRSAPGLNGVVSAVAVMAAGFALLLAAVLLIVLNPIGNPGEVYTRSENLGKLSVWGVALGAVSPFVILASYLGARLGGRLRSRTIGSAP